MKRTAASILALFALAMLARPASAQDRSQPLLGERDLGMAGAVTGSARGPTAAYYNPAGLGTGGRTALGGSLSLRTFRAYGIADGYVSSAGVEDLDDATLDSVSVFLGGMVAFGDRDRFDNRQHALGAGTLVRSSVDRSFFDSAGDASMDLAASLDVSERRIDRWYYVSYAARPVPELALGVTAALSVRSERYQESSSDGVGLGEDSIGARLTARDVDIDLETLHLVLRAGATWRITDWLQAGVVFQGPGIPLSSSGSASFQRLSVQDPDSTLFRRELEPSGSAPAPWELRTGLYARFAPEIGVGLDVGFVGPVGSEDDPWLALGQPVPLDGDRPAATFFAGERRSSLGIEAALGVEIDAIREVPMRAGVLFEHSGNASASQSLTRPVLDSQDRVGGTLSVGVHDDLYDFTIGAAYSYGWGTASRTNPDIVGPNYLPANVESHQVVLVLSGVTGAAADLALEAYRSLSVSQDEDEEEEAAETQEVASPGPRAAEPQGERATEGAPAIPDEPNEQPSADTPRLDEASPETN